MKKLLYLAVAFCFLPGCDASQKPDSENNGSDSLTNKVTIREQPHVAVEITLSDSVFKFGEDIGLKIKLTNYGSVKQKLLFDKPFISTGGPWKTTAVVTDRKTNLSVLKYENKGLLNSKAYSEEELKDMYYYLSPGQSIEKQYNLSDIAVISSNTGYLPQGSYDIQLRYYSNISNRYFFRIIK